MTDQPDWAIGIEEEYLLLDVAGGGLSQASAQVRAEMAERHDEEVEPELLQSQVEVATGVHPAVPSAGEELAGLRRRLGEAARARGAALVAAGCHPTAAWAEQLVTDKQRYRELAEGMGQVARETVVCGLHVHVGIADPEARIRAVNGARPWLAPLLALSASSPYWQGSDTGFASYRTPVFRRWPNTGIPHTLDGWDDFEGLVADLVAAGVVGDGTNLYWDIRPSVRYPTVEVRVADSCPRLGDSLVVAALVRAVLRTVVESPGRTVTARHEVIEAAVRHAARHGLSGSLIDPSTGHQAPAGAVVAGLVGWCREALEAAADLAMVEEGVRSIVDSGGAAGRLRTAQRRGGWPAVTEVLVTETAGAQATPTAE